MRVKGLRKAGLKILTGALIGTLLLQYGGFFAFAQETADPRASASVSGAQAVTVQPAPNDPAKAQAAVSEAAVSEAAVSDAAVSEAAGSEAAGSEAAGSDAAVSEAAGSEAAGSEAAGSEAAPPPVAPMQAAPRAATHTMEDFVTKSTLYHGANIDPAKIVKSGDIISESDTLLIHHNFALTEHQIAAIDADSNKAYALPLPNGLAWLGNTDSTKPLNLEISDALGNIQAIKFADLVYTAATKTCTVQFVEKLGEQITLISDAFVVETCQLDQNTIGGSEQIKIELMSGVTVDIIVKETMKIPPSIVKTGSYDAITGRFTWTVNYTHGDTTKASLPIYLCDTFALSGQVYVADSFMVDGNLPAAGTLVSQADADNKNWTLQYQLPDTLAAGAKLLFAYQTALSDAAVNSHKGSDITVKNAAVLKDAKGAQVGDAPQIVSVTAKGNDVFWITKTGDGSGQKSRITWRLTVKTLDRNLANLVLYDTFPSELTLDTNSVTVNGIAAASSGFTLNSINPAEYPTGTPASFSLAFPQNLTATEYKIEYVTTVPDDFYIVGKDVKVTNNARLAFDWYEYGTVPPNSPVAHTPPEVKKDVWVKAALLQIGVETPYNPADQSITWKCVINAHGVDFQSGQVTDDLSTMGLAYVDNSFVCTDHGAIVTLDTTPVTGTTKDKLVVNVGALGANSANITFQTKVTDPEKYAYNYDKPLKNTAKITATIVGATSESSTSATASTQVKSEVLSKSAGVYNYTDKTIEWTLRINKNKMAMPDVKIEDPLVKGLHYQAGSMTVTDESGNAISGVPTNMTVTSVSGAEMLALDLAAHADQKTLLVKFKTKVNVMEIPAFVTLTEVEIQNTASLLRNGYPKTALTNSTTKVTIANKEMNKTSKPYVPGKPIAYSIDININGLVLNSTKLTDAMPEGLLLDFDSVKLWQAEPQGTNPVLKKIGSVPVLTATDAAFSYHAATRTMSITLPDGNLCYILEYGADVTDLSKAPFKNTVTLSGYASGNDGDTNNPGGGGGGGIGQPTVGKGSAEVTKFDARRAGIALEGVTFELYDTVLKKVMAQKTTDATGKAVFHGMLKYDRDYEIREIAPLKPGYPTAAAPIAAKVTAAAPTATYRVENAPQTADFSFTKRSDAGKALAGVGFTISDQTVGSKLTKTVQSDANGTVMFTDVPFGTYLVVESTVPQYYKACANFYAVLAVDGTVSFTDSNHVPLIGPLTIINEHIAGSLTIFITDKTTGRPLVGVEFTLYDDTGKECGKGKTDAAGMLSFEGLKRNKVYRAKESPYAGYQPLANDVSISLGSVPLTVTVENVPVIITPAPPQAVPPQSLALRLPQTGQNWLLAILLGSAGLILLVLGFLMRHKHKRRRRHVK